MDEEIEQLDLKDKKLLYELDFGARMSYSQLGRRIGLSKQGVEYKMQNLTKKGIIQGFYPVVNVSKLGYLYCRLFLVLNNVSEKKEQEIIDYQKNHKNFFWIFTGQGKYDILSALWVKSITEFRQTVDDLMAKFGREIKLKEESITTDVIHYQNRWLLELRETREIHLRESSEKVDLNEKEINLLKIISENARMPIISIAKKMRCSAKIVAYALKKLERDGIIEGYRPIINHHKLGYSYYKLWIHLNYDDLQEVSNLYDYLKGNPLVLYVVKGIGFPKDLDVEIMVKNSSELFHFVSGLRSKFPKLIGEYDSTFFSDLKKVKYVPF